MYQYTQTPTGNIKNKLDKIDEKIKEETDINRKIKIKEQRCIVGMFDDAYFSRRIYQNPW